MKKPLHVLVVDDHALFRQGLISLMLTRDDLVQVVGEAADGEEALRMAAELQPDVILMDIYMPGGGGLQATSRILQQQPATAVVMLTSSEDDEHLYQAVQLGAAGYLLKTLEADELFDLLESVADGEAALTRVMASRLLRRISKGKTRPEEGHSALSVRELDVLRMVAQGITNAEIAEELCIAVNTVKVHLRNIYSKLQLENRSQAAVYAVQAGLLEQADHKLD